MVNFKSSLVCPGSTDRPKPDNLTPGQRQALKNLKTNENIIIKPADKGGAVVVQDKDDYINEANRQLNDPAFYSTLQSDPTNDFTCELNQLLCNVHPQTSSIVSNLIPKDPRPGIFYMLPKIHKLGPMVSRADPPAYQAATTRTKIFDIARQHGIVPPSRPIVSSIGMLTEHLSGYIDTLLQPLMCFIPSFIQDTTDFLNKLSSLPILPDGTLMVTMDVTSLYTNIPHDEGTTACHNLLRCLQPTEIPIEDTALLIDFVLKHNHFEFNDRHYLQTNGTAMGTKMAPTYANIFMSVLEGQFLQNSEYKPLFYCRYIDDIFLYGLMAKKNYSNSLI